MALAFFPLSALIIHPRFDAPPFSGFAVSHFTERNQATLSERIYRASK
jgi:hypothetical protein